MFGECCGCPIDRVYWRNSVVKIAPKQVAVATRIPRPLKNGLPLDPMSGVGTAPRILARDSAINDKPRRSKTWKCEHRTS